MTEVRVNRLLSGVTTLGPGSRVALWVQGCRLACPGCASRDTWDTDAGTAVPVVDLAATVTDLLRAGEHTGLTLTGGEPVDQGDVLAELVTTVARELPDVDVLLFTGYTAAVAERRAPTLWRLVDTAVSGRYRREMPSDDPIRASANQELVHRTERGRRRFHREPPRRRLQVHVDEQDVYVVGMPRAGDLTRWVDDLEARGVSFEGVSWLT